MDKSKAKLLLADSDRDYARVLGSQLESEGWNTDLAHSPEEALKKVSEVPYDLCILDLRLAGDHDDYYISGPKLIRELAGCDPLLRFIAMADDPRYEAVRNALRRASRDDPHALDFHVKREGSAALVRLIERAYLPRTAELCEIIHDQRLPSVVVAEFQAIDQKLIHWLKENPAELYQLPPRIFEELVAELLASYGWSVDLTKRTRDGGYDIFAVQKDISGLTSSWIVECKRYREDRKVGIAIVRQLYAVKADLGAGMAMLATTSHFSRDVSHYKATRLDLELRDFEGIVEWINEYRPHPGGKLFMKDRSVIVPGDPEWQSFLEQPKC